MSADIIVIIIFSIMGLVAHGARNHHWMELTLRVIYAFAFVAELWTALVVFPGKTYESTLWSTAVTATMAVLTGVILFRWGRKAMSWVLTPLNNAINGQLIYALVKKKPWREYAFAEPVMIPESIPHMNGMFIYITVLGSLLANINLENFQAPAIGIPFPVPLDSLFSYNFLGLVILAACGAGIFVARKPKEVLVRLGLVKPAGWHIGIALLMVPVTFGYDYLWSLFTESSGVGGKLSMYNSGTFTAGGGGQAAFLALATGMCAGLGEEVLMRGGLQPAFGIIPAGILHGVLHGQFQHAPILIVQVAGWSIIMGIVRKYTNTTTTIITHATFNFLTTFLFAFNP